jgi:hypothetical protein
MCEWIVSQCTGSLNLRMASFARFATNHKTLGLSSLKSRACHWRNDDELLPSKTNPYQVVSLFLRAEEGMIGVRLNHSAEPRRQRMPLTRCRLPKISASAPPALFAKSPAFLSAFSIVSQRKIVDRCSSTCQVNLHSSRTFGS